MLERLGKVIPPHLLQTLVIVAALVGSDRYQVDKGVGADLKPIKQAIASNQAQVLEQLREIRGDQRDLERRVASIERANYRSDTP